MPLTQDRIRSFLDQHAAPLLGKKFGPAVALPIAVGVGILAASMVILIVEGLFGVHWWTALAYMMVFFTVAVITYRRISPRGTRLAADAGRRYLEESGTLELIEAAKDVRQVLAKSR